MWRSKTRIGISIALGLLVLAIGASALARGLITDGPFQTVSAQADKPFPVLSYSAKFVCLEPIQSAVFTNPLWFGSQVPLLREATEVLVHNPNDFPVLFFKKAVFAPLETVHDAGIEFPPKPWHKALLKPDFALRLDCDEITKLLTGVPTATFLGTYGVGVKVEGFVVVGIGPQTVAGTTTPLENVGLDVTAEYNKGSEVLKKDITFQPWWVFWWWDLPWALGYSHQRILQVDNTRNIDCRRETYSALAQDVVRELEENLPKDDPSHPAIRKLRALGDPDFDTIQTEMVALSLRSANPIILQATGTVQALGRGHAMDPTSLGPLGDVGGSHRLVVMMGGCDHIDPTHIGVNYAILSTDSPADHPPGQAANSHIIHYPWWPGRWYDLTVVVPQNRTIDLDQYIRDWVTNDWVKAGADAPTASALVTKWFFPWWCGWGYWWWWWGGGDCVDIGVGEGESIDVEQVVPLRVNMKAWPPQ